MLEVNVICVGRMKEKFYIAAAEEYIKRLGAYCKISVTELPEAKRSQDPSPKETEAALEKEAAAILAAVPRGAKVVALCVEGKELSSEALSRTVEDYMKGGASKLAFVIGGSDGLSPAVKAAADLRLSMSPMTFPHHLARVMVLEQIYRAMTIISGTKYHK